MNESTARDVIALTTWKEEVAEPALIRLDTLWSDRNFAKGALWVIMGMLTVLMGAFGISVQYFMSHKITITEQPKQAQENHEQEQGQNRKSGFDSVSLYTITENRR